MGQVGSVGALVFAGLAGDLAVFRFEPRPVLDDEGRGNSRK